MAKTKCFDYQALAKKKKIKTVLLKKIEKEVKKEFPDDEMMFELHMIRALRK